MVHPRFVSARMARKHRTGASLPYTRTRYLIIRQLLPMIEEDHPNLTCYRDPLATPPAGGTPSVRKPRRPSPRAFSLQ